MRHYYISSGAKNGFYTLRSLSRSAGSEDAPPFVQDNYCCNLATDWDRALEKARSRATRAEIKLYDGGSFDLTPFGKSQAAWQFILDTADIYALPFGKHRGEDFRKVGDRCYLSWLLGALYQHKEQSIIPVRVALALFLGDDWDLNVREAQRRQQERIAIREANKKPVPTGRVTFTGKVIRVRVVDGQWGTQIKITVACDGFAVYGTAASSLGHVQEGDEVEITATIKTSPDDNSFGFFKRPTKSNNLTQQAKMEAACPPTPTPTTATSPVPTTCAA